MKKIYYLLAAAFLLFPAASYAGANDASGKPTPTDEQAVTDAGRAETGVRAAYLAEQKIRSLPSIHGDTVDSYLTNMTRIPIAEDLGWQVNRLEDGYEVVRSILVDNEKKHSFKWKVSDSGEVSPLNDGARSMTKQPDQTIK